MKVKEGTIGKECHVVVLNPVIGTLTSLMWTFGPYYCGRSNKSQMEERPNTNCGNTRHAVVYKLITDTSLSKELTGWLQLMFLT